jgi:hypothetical protein
MPSTTSFVDAGHITAHLNGTPAWGIEPWVLPLHGWLVAA